MSPIRMLIFCPNCGLQHIDYGEWATRPHHTHQCVGQGDRKGCGHVWDLFPNRTPTIGVSRFDSHDEGK